MPCFYSLLLLERDVAPSNVTGLESLNFVGGEEVFAGMLRHLV